MRLPETVRSKVVDLRGKVVDLLPRLRGRKKSREVPVPVAVRSELDRALDRFFADWPEFWRPRFGWFPPVDVKKEGRELLFRVDLPGVRPEDVEVRVSANQLVLEAERRHEEESRGDDYYWMERSYGSFHRAFPLPADADVDGVRAEFKNGVLQVRVPLREGGQVKRVPVAA
ncbi:MAG: heat-shock protein [Candidatus Binatia bacterium]|nr:MAG: heat-shock protein [Candidatus Binatia bacterium]